MDSKVIAITLRNAAVMALSAEDYEQFVAIGDLLIFLRDKNLVKKEDIEKIWGTC